MHAAEERILPKKRPSKQVTDYVSHHYYCILTMTHDSQPTQAENEERMQRRRRKEGMFFFPIFTMSNVQQQIISQSLN